MIYNRNKLDRLAREIQELSEAELAELIHKLDRDTVLEFNEKTAALAAGSYAQTTAVCSECGKPR